MIRLFKTHYLKSRIIGLSYTLDHTLVEMAKQGFENPDSHFLDEDAMEYYDAKFLSYIVTRWHVDKSKFSKYELAKYDEGLNKLNKYTELKTFMDNVSKFHWELRALYLEIQRELTTPNFWSRREYSTHTFEMQVGDSLKKYIKLIQDLKDYPEWQDKVKDETGYYAHLLFNCFSGESKNFQGLFSEFGKQNTQEKIPGCVYEIREKEEKEEKGKKIGEERIRKEKERKKEKGKGEKEKGEREEKGKGKWNGMEEEEEGKRKRGAEEIQKA